MLRTKNPR